MNYHIAILLSVAVAAFALPLPDEEVPLLQKPAGVPEESATSIGDLAKSEPNLITVEEGTNTVVGNATSDSQPKTDIESEFGKPTEKGVESTSIAEDDIKEVPKSMPVLAREDTEAVVPPFAGVRTEPKEGVEIGEAKSTASSPGTDEVENKPETKVAGDVKPSTESSSIGTVEKKEETPVAEDKPKTDEKTPAQKPSPAEGEKTEPSVVTEGKKTDKPDLNTKQTEVAKVKPEQSSEGNKSEESAESKESEESDESNKSK